MDEVERVEEAAAIQACHRLARRGFLFGGSTGTVVSAGGWHVLTGIQVNGLGPGYFKTELTQALVDNAEFSAWLVGRTPSRRWGDVDDLIGAAVFLASAASGYVTGQLLFVDGGQLA